MAIIAVIVSCSFAFADEGQETEQSDSSLQNEREFTEPQDPFYRIKPGDTVSIQIFNENNMGIQQRLDVDGSIVVPILGRVYLSKLTIREAEAHLEQQYIEQEILIEPQVSLSIANYTGEVFYIFGEVARPGAKVFPPGRQTIDVLEAITLAGDLSQYAKRSELILRRPDPLSGKEKKIVIDLDKLMRGSTSEKLSDYEVRPGDILFVPERLF